MAVKFQFILLASGISQYTPYTPLYQGRCPLRDTFKGCAIDLFVCFVRRFEHYWGLRSCTLNCGVCRVNKGNWITVGNCERSNSALILLHLRAVKGKTHRHSLLHCYYVVLYLEGRQAHFQSDAAQQNISYVLFRDLLSGTILLLHLTKYLWTKQLKLSKYTKEKMGKSKLLKEIKKEWKADGRK